MHAPIKQLASEYLVFLSTNNQNLDYGRNGLNKTRFVDLGLQGKMEERRKMSIVTP